MKYALVLILLILSCTGCEHSYISSKFTNQNTLAVQNKEWYKPSVRVHWHWQLAGKVNPNYDVEIFDMDLFDSPVSLINQLQKQNKKIICYFSAGSYESWRTDANKFLVKDLGNTLADWEDEKWLDIRSPQIWSIMQDRLDLAQEKGCDGVEPDNVDGYANNSGFDLTPEDQLKYNRLLAKEAHSRNLAIGLKNDLDQVDELVDDFDFAVNEQCFEYAECDRLTVFIEQGKPVLNAEYHDDYVNNSIMRKSLCDRASKMQFSTMILPLDLDDEFRFSCF